MGQEDAGDLSARVPVTSRDFLFTFQALTDKKNGATDWQALYAPVRRVRILDRVGPHVAVRIGLKLGAIELRPTFEHTDPVLQHGRLPSWDQVLVRGRSKELKARALKFRLRDGVLSDQPGGVRGSFADQAFRRPSDLGHDRPEPQRILLVNGGHTWIIALV